VLRVESLGVGFLGLAFWIGFLGFGVLGFRVWVQGLRFRL
jgi:hypothetical protein